MDKQLVERFAGLGPRRGKSSPGRDREPRAIVGSLSEVMSDIQNHRYHPNRVVQGEKPTFP